MHLVSGVPPHACRTMAHLITLQNMVSNALDVVEFKLSESPAKAESECIGIVTIIFYSTPTHKQKVRDRADIENDAGIFHPTFAHQVFGENENIFGYKDLHVRLFYTAGSLNIYLGQKYAERVDDFDSSGIRADDVQSKVAELITNGCYYTNVDEFCKKLESDEQFRPLGEKVDELRVEDEHGAQRTFEFYKCDIQTPGFVQFHARLQTFILWFVDAGSYIDVDDPQWSFYVW